MAKKLSKKQIKARAAAAAKKMTVGKVLKIGAIAGPAAHRGIKYWTTGAVAEVKYGIPMDYSGLDFRDKSFSAGRMIKGYGGAVNHAIEKKVFKALKVRGPRTQISTFGDALDYVTYFGKTAVEIAENRANPQEASRQAYKTQYGVDLDGLGTAAYQPLDMIVEKWGPYLGQKYARKLLRAAGINLSMKLGG